ncbi:MAG: hypothetical protein JSV49_02460 [Thermoplasmata archaeon]|nr:MAG: hypothetical protein JSV49_02460 [Thermoplasmata archaeon]
MFEGWILDVYPSYDFDTMNVWLWTRSGARVITDKFSPCFYVYGSQKGLRECARNLADNDSIDSISFLKRRLHLESDKLYEVLEIAVKNFREFKKLPALINRWGRYTEFQLFDVDLRLAQKYMYSKGIFPMAYVKVGRAFRLNDDVYSMDYEVPPLRSVELAITVKSDGFRKNGVMNSYVSYDDPLSAVQLNAGDGESLTLESNGTNGSERELMLELVEAVRALDPDVIYTTKGDEVIFPYLYYRADLQGLGAQFALDRDRTAGTGQHYRAYGKKDDCSAGTDSSHSHSHGTNHRPESDGKSYFSYGRIYYKPPFYSLKGRLHIDRRVSFIHRESGFFGLVELARLAGIPLQTMSRLSPGTAISAIQMGQAMRDGVLIKWKKNQPEEFKSATELLTADRGGHIFDPCAGIHENVVEVDFTSLYPSIIARKNISPETLLCMCCANQPDAIRIPGLNYHICTRRRGLIPKVVAPIIARRIVYKRRGGEVNDSRQKVLKWVLVTCFGYTGYRNARFGRIECHESITAVAREVMLDAMEIAEAHGYEVLHGFVDSLWLKPAREYYPEPGLYNLPDTPAPVEVVCREISRRIGVPLELEGHYKWIVFLPNKSFDVGALTRYYGLLSDGTVKVRGIELRQHSTPQFFARFQTDILEVFKNASCVSELYDSIPEVLKLFADYAEKILTGSCDARELVFNMRVTRAMEDYRVFNNQLAALTQLDDYGIEVHPGENVSYMISDCKSRNPYKRVKLAEALQGDESYDRYKYLEFLCRTGESILRPFGYREDILAKYIEKTKQRELDEWQEAEKAI